MPVQLDLILPDDAIVYRSFSRTLDEDGRVKDADFLLRENEETLSVARTGEKAMDELEVRGYVPIAVRNIRKLGLDVRCKEGEGDDPDLLEIVGIPHENADSFGISLAANAGMPKERPEHRARIRAAKAAQKIKPE